MGEKISFIDLFGTELELEDEYAREQLSNESAARAEDVAVLEARMDTFTALPAGSTSGDAELMDIRVGADGVTYANAGDAVRGQANNLKTNFELITNSESYYFEKDKSITVHLNPVDYENPVDEPNWECAVVPCEEGDTFYVKGWGASATRLYCFVDTNHNYINSNIAPAQTHITEYTEIVAPPNAVVLVVNSKYTETPGGCIKGKSVSERLEVLQEVLQEDYNKKLSKKLDYETGKNIFNPNTSNKRSGVYVAYNTGRPQINESFSTVGIEVSEGDVLSFNLGNLHVCAFSEISDLPTVPIGMPLTGYMSGFADSQQKQGYVVPEGCVWLTVSYPTASENTLQIESGETSTDYEPYVRGLHKDKIIDLTTEEEKIVYVGSGLDYETIQEAVNAVPSNTTIFITNGTYDEAVDVVSSGKFLILKGESRDGVIITHDGADYYSPPLEMGRGIVEDLTIIRTGTTSTSVGGAYCVHIDYNALQNSTLQFKNVRFINTNRQCVGIGLRRNCRLSFVQCEFETDNAEAFYCHEEQADDVSAQYVELIDCSLRRNSDGYVILLQETPALSNNSATIRVQRCIVKNSPDNNNVIHASQYGTQPGLNGDGYLGTTLFTLDPMSSLNNKDILNASAS